MKKLPAEMKKAIKKGDLAAVQGMVAEGLPVDAELPGKVTALEFALQQVRHAIARTLLDLGAKPRHRKNENLLLAVPKFRDLELLRRLVERGADISAPDRKGFTPFLAAVSAGFYDAVEYLLTQGADPQARTDNGDSAVDLLQRSRVFCQELLPAADAPLAESFRAQLADLDRIEMLLQTTLGAERFQRLGRKPDPPLEPFTTWSLAGDVLFRLEITPSPFTSDAVSRLDARLSMGDRSWKAHFGERRGEIYFRLGSGHGSRHHGDWAPFRFTRSDRRFLYFVAETSLPPGEVVLDIRFETDQEIVDGKLEGWHITVGQ